MRLGGENHTERTTPEHGLFCKSPLHRSLTASLYLKGRGSLLRAAGPANHHGRLEEGAIDKTEHQRPDKNYTQTHTEAHPALQNSPENPICRNQNSTHHHNNRHNPNKRFIAQHRILQMYSLTKPLQITCLQGKGKQHGFKI